MSVWGNPTLQRKLLNLQKAARAGTLAKWKIAVLNSSEVGHCWFREKPFKLSDDQLESISIEHIRVSKRKEHALYTRGVLGVHRMSGNVFDMKTRFEGIGEDGSDEGETRSSSFFSLLTDFILSSSRLPDSVPNPQSSRCHRS